MNIQNIEKKEKNMATFEVKVPADVFDNAVNEVYKKNKSQLYVAGFRKGKAPRAVIEGMYGKDVFYPEAIETLAQEAFEAGRAECGFECVGAPSLLDQQINDDKELIYTFEVAVYPEVVLGQYKGLEGVYSVTEVTDEDVDKELADERKRNARYEDVDRPVQKGDSIVFDFEGFVDGVPFEGGKAENYSLEVGSGAFIPGFEDQLVGMEAEKDGEVHVTFPEQYAENLAGKDATFKVKIHAIREPQLPELDDEFAKDVSEFDTLDEYKADIRKNLTESRAADAERNFKTEIMNKALDNMSVTIPESMIAEKTDEFLRNYADSLGIGRNVSRADLIKGLGMTEESFTAMMRPGAERQVQADLLLDAVVKAEDLHASDEDKEKFYKQLEEDYGENAEKVKGMIDEHLMMQDIERRKAADLIYESAVKTEPKAEEAAEAPAEAPAEENKD